MFPEGDDFIQIFCACCFIDNGVARAALADPLQTKRRHEGRDHFMRKPTEERGHGRMEAGAAESAFCGYVR
jgi:hypothetical protein